MKHETALVSPQARIGDGTKVWAFCNIQSGAVIGSGCNIGDHCYVESGVFIGDNVTIKNGVSIFDGVILEDSVFVGPAAVFTNDRYPRSRAANWKLERTIVKKGASVGGNATVLCGVTIGERAVVGAGAVVVEDVPAYAIVVGNPARRVGTAGDDGRPCAAQAQRRGAA
ncbi:MAG: acyltransferase [Candidatus Omnitrophota bacterium]